MRIDNIILTMTLLGLSLIFALNGCQSIIDKPYVTKQVELAKQFGVKIEDFPDRTSFPIGYFSSILKPGMTIEEVHKVVKRYEKVLYCGTTIEIYYYFDGSDENALRFYLFYDSQGKFKRIEGEDQDSKTIRTDGCEPGLIIDR